MLLQISAVNTQGILLQIYWQKAVHFPSLSIYKGEYSWLIHSYSEHIHLVFLTHLWLFLQSKTNCYLPFWISWDHVVVHGIHGFRLCVCTKIKNKQITEVLFHGRYRTLWMAVPLNTLLFPLCCMSMYLIRVKFDSVSRHQKLSIFD